MKKNVLVKTALLLVVMLFSMWGKVSAQEVWQKVDISDLTSSDVFVIVDSTSNNDVSYCYAMPNDGGSSSSPSTVLITVSGDQITSEVPERLKWNISGDNTSGYTLYPNGTAESWLYLSSDGTQTLRVGNSSTNNTFSYDETRQLLKNIATERFIGVFFSTTNGSASWRCYKTSNLSSIQNSHARFYKLIGATPATVSTPTFSPAGGTYYEPQTVTISCATEGAVIRYTLDGTTPNESSAVYSTPFTVSTTTTVKAIAILGEETSYTASVRYVFPHVSSIAELRRQEADETTIYTLTSEAVVTFASSTYRHQKFLQDATGGIVVDDNNGTITSEYVAGDGMTGLSGKLKLYKGLLEFIPSANPGEATSHGNVVTPAVIDLTADFEEYEAQLVKVTNVTVVTDNEYFAPSTTYDIDGSSIKIYYSYSDCPVNGMEIPSSAQNITALVYQYNNHQLVPLAFEPYSPEPTECENVPTMGTCTAVLDNRDMLFSGQIAVDDPLCTLHEYGFVYSTTNTTPMLDSVSCMKVVLGTTVPADSVFTHRIAELGHDTYYVRAYATNGEGTGYSEVTSILQAEPEQYTVHFMVSGHLDMASVPAQTFTEGHEAMTLPIVDGCENLAFAGWTLQPFEGQTSDRPAMFSTFAPTSDTTFYAVFSNIQNVTNDEIVISRSSFAENVTTYTEDDEWTAVSKIRGTEILGVCNVTNNDTTMQMRASSKSHPYNTTALPGVISSISMYASTSGTARNWKPYLSITPLTSENYQTGAALQQQLIATGSSFTWDVDASYNANYFYIELSGGAAYIDSIVVAYTSGDALYTMLAVDTVTINQTICEGMTYEDDHFNTEEEGTHTYLQENNAYCATYYVLNLSLAVRDTLHHYVDTCDLYVLNEEEYSNSADVEIITPSEETYACPVVDEWYITIRHSSELVLKEVACDSYTWNDTTYYQSGDYTQVFTNAEGCDSTVTLMLTVNYSTHNVTDTTVCESIMWNENTYTVSGTYTYDYVNENECASTDTLHLTVNYGTHNVTDTTVCGRFEWNGETYTTSGTYTYDYVNATECASTDTLHLTVNHGDYTEMTVDTCSTEFYWEVSNATYSASGTYVFYSENANTCQDTAVLNLFLHPSVTTEFNAQICEGETYSLYGFNVSEAGNYQLDLQTVYGCDSTVILHLTVGSEAITNIAASICEGENFNEYGFEVLAPAAGIHEYSDTIRRSGTCDSVVVLTLTVNEPTEGETSATACSSYIWYGEILTATGDYTHVLTNAAGCDSTVTLHLTVNVPTEGDTTATACSSYIWYGETLTATGDYTHVLTNAAGCDSTVTLHLTINVPTEGETSATACNSYSWYGETLTESGDYTHVLEGGNAAGCDSTVTLHLTINVPTEGETSATACSSYSWYGETLTTTGDYTHVLTNVAGCDSTVTLHLTINVPTEGETTATACSSYIWYGETLTTTGDYTHVLTNVAGCDSMVTLHLTINVPTEGETTATACSSYIWYGETLTTTGDYTHVLTNAAGCDSTVTLHLTINVPTEGDTTATACSIFNWYGDNLTESGDYTHVLEGGNAAGCDSTVTLHLTINVADTTEFTETACDSYVWNNEVYEESGDYVQTFTNVNGCDSVVTLHLTVTTINTEVLVTTTPEEDVWSLEVMQDGADYQWIDCETNEAIEGEVHQGFHPAVSGHYACIITMGECTDTTECQEVTITSIVENGMADLTLYPNPTTGIVSIRLTPETCTLKPEIHLFDIYGRRLQVMSVTGETTQIDLSRYATGIYIVKYVNDGKVVAVKKVVKE